MLEPKKLKYRKQHRNRGAFGGKATSGAELAFGSYGLKAMSGGELTARQIEAARRALTHEIQRVGKVWIRPFPHTPVTRKAAEVPMGSGKGSVEYYACIVRPGMIIFEMDGLPEPAARRALTLAGHKLPFKTRVVAKPVATATA
jgi:large subunit ribosomal protein L16